MLKFSIMPRDAYEFTSTFAVALSRDTKKK